MSARTANVFWLTPSGDQAPQPLTVIVNWPALLKNKRDEVNRGEPILPKRDRGRRERLSGVISPKSQNPLQASQIQMAEPALWAVDSVSWVEAIQHSPWN
jgi:hypothetical protein